MSRSYKKPYHGLIAGDRKQTKIKRFAKKYLNNRLKSQMKMRKNLELNFNYCLYKKINNKYLDELFKIPMFSDIECYNYLDKRLYTKQQLSK